MRIIKLFFPGQFEDAFVYMGRIIAITQERTLRVCDLEEVVIYLERQYPFVAPLPTWMFLRNDWLAGAQFEALITNKGIAQAIVSTFDQFPDPVVELSNAFFGGNEEDITAIFRYIDPIAVAFGGHVIHTPAYESVFSRSP